VERRKECGPQPDADGPGRSCRFVKQTMSIALAIASDTSHGAYKFPPSHQTGDILANRSASRRFHARSPTPDLVICTGRLSGAAGEGWGGGLAIINESVGEHQGTYDVPVKENRRRHSSTACAKVTSIRPASGVDGPCAGHMGQVPQ